MKNTIFYTLIACIFLCCKHKELPKAVIEPQPLVNQIDTLQIQSASNILGDKIIESDSVDINGLKSPETIFILEERDTFPSTQSDMVISTKGYYYKGKTSKYIAFSKQAPSPQEPRKYFKAKIYRMRENNFSDDKRVKFAALKSVYKNYEVSCFDSLRRIYMVRPLKLYHHARPFIRLIKYDKKGRQKSSITLNDFEIGDRIATPNGYMLGLNNYGFGAVYYFLPTHCSYKIVWLDYNLKVLDTFHTWRYCTELQKLSYYRKGLYSATLRIHLGCTVCSESDFYYELFFTKNYQLSHLNIKKQVADRPIMERDLMQELKEHSK